MPHTPTPAVCGGSLDIPPFATSVVRCAKQAFALDHHRRRQVGHIRIDADPLYQHPLITAERKFWRCVESGDRPHLFSVETE